MWSVLFLLNNGMKYGSEVYVQPMVLKTYNKESYFLY